MHAEAIEVMTHTLHKIEDKNKNFEAIFVTNTLILQHQFKALSEQVNKVTTKLITNDVEIEHLKGKTSAQEKEIMILHNKVKN